MAVNDSERKTRAILESRAEKGKEFQQFQEAQGQLLNLQAEQRNNLNEQRVVSSMEMQNNQTLAQAAEILAASGGAGGMAVAQPQQSGTQAILNKFGINKPGRTTKTSHSVTPQKISITNNTTNNVQLSQPQIPMSNTPIKVGGGNDTAKFKAWVNNAFAKQNEAAAIREKEYQKREWSLTRSTNKMIRKMGELGKSFSERMSPKNIGNVLGNQFKTVMFLMGFQFLADNFKTFLDKFTSFVNWIEGDGLVKKLGGKKGESLLTALKGLFSDLATMIVDRLDIFMTTRGNAIKEIKPPEIDLSKMDLGGIVSSLFGYFGNVISTAFTGAKGLEKSALNTIKQKGYSNSLEHYDDKYSHTQDATSLIKDDKARDTSIGDAVMAEGNFSKNFKMSALDYDSGGSYLQNNVGSSIKQSQYLSNLVDKANNGKTVDTSQFLFGFSALKATARRKKGVLVTGKFIDDIGFFFNIKEITDEVKKNCPTVKVRYILVPKDFKDKQMENAGDYFESLVHNYVNNKAISTIAGKGTRVAANTFREWEKGNYQTAVHEGISGLVANRLGLGDEYSAHHLAIKNKIRSFSVDDYKIKMVKVGDPHFPEDRFPTVLGKNGKALIDINNNTYLFLSYDTIVFLEKKIKETKPNFSFDGDNIESIQILAEIIKKKGGKISSDMKEFEETLNTAEFLKEEEEAYINEFNERHENNRVNRMMNEIGLGSDNIEETSAKTIPISDKEKQENAKKIAEQLLNDKDLGLNKEQVAGILGNIGLESGGFNPSAVNPNDNGKVSSGLVQWRGERREAFKRIYGKYPEEASIEEQVDFIKRELLSSESATLKALKSHVNGTPGQYAEIFMKKYERPSSDPKVNQIEIRKGIANGSADLIEDIINGWVPKQTSQSYSYVPTPLLTPEYSAENIRNGTDFKFNTEPTELVINNIPVLDEKLKTIILIVDALADIVAASGTASVAVNNTTTSQDIAKKGEVTKTEG